MEYSAASCFSCPEGTYNPDAQSTTIQACVLCPEGKFGDEPHSIAAVLVTDVTDADFGSNTCKDCPGGQYSSATGITQVEDCTFCSLGRYSDKQGQTSSSTCYECTYGRYGDEFAAYRNGGSCRLADDCEKSCKNCPAGKYNGFKGRTSIDSCLICTAGKYATGFKIVDGIEVANGGRSCTSCAKGKYGVHYMSKSEVNCTAW